MGCGNGILGRGFDGLGGLGGFGGFDGGCGGLWRLSAVDVVMIRGLQS